MISSTQLLSDLRKLLSKLEVDLRERCDDTPSLSEGLRAQFNTARQAERTALGFDAWRDEYITQAAVAWILACVFVRFIEDNGLIDTPLLAGPGPRLERAKDEQTLYFQKYPTESDREYLLHVFRQVAGFPAARPLFDERHNPLWALGVSGDGATMLVEFFRYTAPDTGALARDFTDPDWNTRFLGDLYQDLSEAARKKYALLQTPPFVVDFILDRTLTPALQEFGLTDVRLIDPACGSGHFLLAAFDRLFQAWQMCEPGVNARVLAQRALDAVSGIDLNPFAVAIARFRLLVAALKACEIRRLQDAPAFRINVATGDSLLHGPRPGGERQKYIDATADPLKHVYDTEDAKELRRLLGQCYHVVVGNPPYITVEDKALNTAYRQRFVSCFRAYHLSVPFIERFFDLAISETSAGFVGVISDNAFMKGQFGRTLVERILPEWDLTHIIDTRFAHLPGHGTPTVILFGRHRKPTGQTVRAVLGLRGETRAPSDPADAPVWTAIVSGIDVPGLSSKFISVVDLPRDLLKVHPWSLGGGGAIELKNLVDSAASHALGDLIADVGAVALTRADDSFVIGALEARRLKVPSRFIRSYVAGEDVRDWTFRARTQAIWPYHAQTLEPDEDAPTLRLLWRFRTELSQRRAFGKSQLERGLPWYAYSMLFADRFRSTRQITFSNVNTHNHFAMATGNVIFNAHAPVLIPSQQLPQTELLKLLGVLNSSISCFWIRQVFQPKGGGGIGRGISTEPWEVRLEIDTTKLKKLPIAFCDTGHIACELTKLSQVREANETLGESTGAVPTIDDFRKRDAARLLAISKMVALQEELDWECYGSYGLLLNPPRQPHPPPIEVGQRAFEIVLARQAAAGETETAWFERNGSTPITEIPAHWPEDYKQVVRDRIEIIERDPNIALIEQPEHKRRWNVEPWAGQQVRIVREWLLGRLEALALWSSGEAMSIAKLSDRMRHDTEFVQVAEVYRGRADFDMLGLVTELVTAEAVPFLPVLRYTSPGLRKRAAWERTWEFQRRQDAIDARVKLREGDAKRLTPEEAAALKRQEVGEIPVPPKYASEDFLSSTFWRLRGKLDFPKERFISYPHAEREADPTLVVGWAGWDHLQQAKALAAYFVRMKETEGWTADRLTPLLAGLLELVPWLLQWHNEIDPAFGIGMGDYFKGFVEEEARALGLTTDDLRNWQPPARSRAKRRARPARAS
jgi:hypothetical protein